MNIIPLPALFLLVVLIALGGVRIGHWFARRRAEGDQDHDGPVGSVAGALLGLLAFMLAFTFGLASERYDTRKQLLLDEVNAISTAAHRAALMPEPYASECRELLELYVDGRVAVVNNLEELGRFISEAEAIQERLWEHGTTLAKQDMNSDIGALFVESLNMVFETHISRVTVALHYRIPTMVWVSLLALLVLSMVGVGYQFGVTGRTNLAVNLILSLGFSLVILLIADLDRSATGYLKVSQQPMIELQKRMAR